jgi:AraC-like DNA-binding protein
MPGHIDVRSGAGTFGSWESAVGHPSPRLDGFVVRYRGFRTSTGVPRARIEIPIGLPSVLFVLDDPLTLTEAASPKVPAVRYRSFAVGLRTNCLRGAHNGWIHGIEVMLTPFGAYALLGCAMSELANAIVDARDLFGPGVVPRIEERLAETPTWAARFDLLDDFFARRAEVAVATFNPVRHAWAKLESGMQPIASRRLADELGWSQRRLELAFRRHIGLAPATIARMARFRRAVRLLVAQQVPLTELATLCGYYDQSHFNREFRSVTGTSPIRYLIDSRGEGPNSNLGQPARIYARYPAAPRVAML